MIPEKWRAVPGYEGFYEASSCGRVRSLGRVVLRSNGRPQTLRGRLMSPSPDTDGYPQVTLSMAGWVKTKPVHKLVALAFFGPPARGQQVRHLDGSRDNCCVENLTYGTPLENSADMRVHGTTNGLKGERNGRALLAEEDVLFIRHSSVDTRELAAQLCVSRSTIRQVRNRSIWKHVK